MTKVRKPWIIVVYVIQHSSSMMYPQYYKKSLQCNTKSIQSITSNISNIKLHISSEEQITKYQLTQLMGKIMDVDASATLANIKPDNNPQRSGTPRPQNTHLDCSKTWEILGMEESYQFVKLEDGVRLALLPFYDLFETKKSCIPCTL